MNSEPQFEMINGAKMAYRVMGSGPALLLVHGWPFYGRSYLALAARLERDFRCYLVDLPGMGASGYQYGTDFSFAGLGAALDEFSRRVIKGDFFCIAHDTGATATRLMAAGSDRVKKLILLNTEIPGHRPPWIEAFQLMFRLPGAKASFRLLLRSRTFLRTGMAYGGCFFDPARIDDEFVADFVTPLIQNPERLGGVVRYLLGIDFRVVDQLEPVHRNLRMPVALVWGAEDPTFPERLARPMLGQFANPAGFFSIPAAKLMVHMERPEEVARIAREIFR